MTPSTHSHTRPFSHGLAVSSAEDDFREQVFAMIEGADHKSITADLIESEAIARLTANYAAGMRTILGRLNYAARPQSHDFIEYLLDQVDDALDHGGGSVVRAQVKMMENGK